MAKGLKTGGGSRKGKPNRAGTIRAAFETAFAALQKDPQEAYHLSMWAKTNPTEFYKLAARLIPQEISGPNGGPIQTEDVSARELVASRIASVATRLREGRDLKGSKRGTGQ